MTESNKQYKIYQDLFELQRQTKIDYLNILKDDFNLQCYKAALEYQVTQFYTIIVNCFRYGDDERQIIANKLSNGESPTSLLTNHKPEELVPVHIIPYFIKHYHVNYQHFQGWHGDTAQIHMSKFEELIDLFKKQLYQTEEELDELHYIMRLKSYQEIQATKKLDKAREFLSYKKATIQLKLSILFLDTCREALEGIPKCIESQHDHISKHLSWENLRLKALNEYVNWTDKKFFYGKKQMTRIIFDFEPKFQLHWS